MKKLINLLVVAFFSIFLLASAAMADKIATFGDNAFFWGDGLTNDWSNGSADDNVDVVGSPEINQNFNDGKVTYTNDGDLIRIDFKVQRPNPFGGSLTLSPGDLFLSVDDDNEWEYFIDLTIGTTWTTPGTGNLVVPSGSYDIYDYSNYGTSTNGIPLGSNTSDPGYTLSSDGSWGGANIREEHPVAWGSPDSDRKLTSQATFSGWPSDNNTVFPFFTFPENLISVTGDDLIIGWAVNCANDVIWEPVDGPSGLVPVPEPATLLLFGAGLVGLGGFGRKFMRKKSKSI